MIRRLLPYAFLGMLATACSGGGGSSLPLAASTASPSGSGTTPQSVAVSIKIPGSTTTSSAFRRHPQYVSPNTQSASISVNGGTPTVVNLAAGSPNCTPSTGSGRTCTITISAPVGTDTFTELMYQSTSGTGPVLSQNTTTAAVAAGKANTVQLVLDGVVASISLSLANTTPPTGAPYSDPLTVNFLDASNAAIIGNAPFFNPITLTDSDTTNVTTLSKTVLNSPADAASLSVAYTGGTLATPATFSATASGVAAANITSATLTPVASSTAFVDWPTYAYDAQRTGFNPYTAAFTPASIGKLKLAWQDKIGGSTQSQPIIATNVAGHQALLIVADFGIAQAYDGLTGKLVWQKQLPGQDGQACGYGAITGTAVYDKALSAIFMGAGNGGTPNHVVLYKLDAATGNVTGSADVTPTLEPGEGTFSHSGVTMANGLIYIGTGSNCEGSSTSTYPSWRGRVAAVNPTTMMLANTFYTTWQVGSQPGNYGGGGVWAWGGVSADESGNIYVSTGNGETNSALGSIPIQPPFAANTNEQAGLAEHVVQLSADLSTVEGSNYPGFNFTIGHGDLDFAGTPVIFQPPGCDVLSASQGKAGLLVVNDTQNGMSATGDFPLSVPSSSAYYMGNPAYSPITHLLYAAISSSGAGSSMMPPGLAAISGCGSSISWTTQFGPDSSFYGGDNPRSAPTVTAGGVVFMATPCNSDGNGGCGAPSGSSPGGAVWAIDAVNPQTVLNGGKPIFLTGANVRMAPSVDGSWLYVLDGAGNFYAYTIDPSVPAIKQKQANRAVQSPYRYHPNS